MFSYWYFYYFLCCFLFCIIDLVGNIILNMLEKRSKVKVIEKLCVFDFVLERKDFYKRRKRKFKNFWDVGEDDLLINDDWSSGESGKEGLN